MNKLGAFIFLFFLAWSPDLEAQDSPLIPQNFRSFSLLEKIQQGEVLLTLSRPMSELERQFVMDLMESSGRSENEILSVAGRGMASLLFVLEEQILQDQGGKGTAQRELERARARQNRENNHAFTDVATGTSLIVGAGSAVLSLVFFQFSLSSFDRFVSSDPSWEDYERNRRDYITQELFSYGFAALAATSAITAIIFELNRN